MINSLCYVPFIMTVLLFYINKAAISLMLDQQQNYTTSLFAVQ